MKCYHHRRYNFCVYPELYQMPAQYKVDIYADLKKFKKPENQIPYDPSIFGVGGGIPTQGRGFRRSRRYGRYSR